MRLGQFLWFLHLTLQLAHAQLAVPDFLSFIGKEPNYPEDLILHSRQTREQCLSQCRSSGVCSLVSYNRKQRHCFEAASHSILNFGLSPNEDVTSFYKVFYQKNGSTSRTRSIGKSFTFLDVSIPWKKEHVRQIFSNCSLDQCTDLCHFDKECASFTFHPANKTCNVGVYSMLRSDLSSDNLFPKVSDDTSLYFEKLNDIMVHFNYFSRRQLRSKVESNIISVSKKRNIFDAVRDCLNGETCVSLNYDVSRNSAELLSTMFNSTNDELAQNSSSFYIEMKVITKKPNAIFDASEQNGQIVTQNFPNGAENSANVVIPIPDTMEMSATVTRFTKREPCPLILTMSSMTRGKTTKRRVMNCRSTERTFVLRGDSVALQFDKKTSDYSVTARVAYRLYYNCSHDINMTKDFGNISFLKPSNSTQKQCRWNLKASDDKSVFLFFFRLPKDKRHVKLWADNVQMDAVHGFVGKNVTIEYSAKNNSQSDDFVVFYRQTPNNISVFQEVDTSPCRGQCVLELREEDLSRTAFIDLSRRFAISSSVTDDKIAVFVMSVRKFGFGHRDPHGRCHFGEMLIYAGDNNGNSTSTVPMLNLCGSLRQIEIRLPFPGAEIKIRYANTSDNLSSEEKKGLNITFKTIFLERPKSTPPATEQTAKSLMTTTASKTDDDDDDDELSGGVKAAIGIIVVIVMGIIIFLILHVWQQSLEHSFIFRCCYKQKEQTSVRYRATDPEGIINVGFER